MACVKPSTLGPLLSRMTKNDQTIEYGSSAGTLRLTKKGQLEADPGDIPSSNEEHHKRIQQQVKGKKARAIFALLADGDRTLSKMELMKAVDCTNPKTFGPLLSRELKKPGYIEYTDGNVRLSDSCYPYGRS